MSSVLNTSTMKSPPLVVWVCGSFSGGEVSSAVWIGPGAAALRFARGAASVAPFRNVRRSGSGDGRRFDMAFLQRRLSHRELFCFEAILGWPCRPVKSPTCLHRQHARVSVDAAMVVAAIAAQPTQF